MTPTTSKPPFESRAELLASSQQLQPMALVRGSRLICFEQLQATLGSW